MKNYSDHFIVEEIGAGVYAAIAVDGKGAASNAGIIDLGNLTLIFDTFNTQQAAEDLKAASIELTGNHQINVINSHWHGDHIRGNQVFKTSPIISTIKTKELMEKKHPERIKMQKEMLPDLEKEISSIQKKIDNESDILMKNQLMKQYSFLREIQISLPSLELTLPNLTFDKNLNFNGSSKSVQVISFGAAHTFCDSVLYIPSDKVIFAGDIISIKNHPLLRDGDYDHWIEVLETMNRMDILTVVPGHGPVGKKDAIQEIKEYIQCLLNQVEEMISQGLTIDQIEEIEMPEIYHWDAESLYYQNLRFLYEKKIDSR